MERGRMARVVACCEDGQDVSSLEVGLAEFASHGAPMKKAVAGMLALFRVYAENGRMRSTRLFHEANKPEAIYEFRKGDLRVFFFFSSDGGEIVVCSHVDNKTTRKVKAADIGRAKNLRTKFLAAQAADRIDYIDGGLKS